MLVCIPVKLLTNFTADLKYVQSVANASIIDHTKFIIKPRTAISSAQSESHAAYTHF